MVRRSVMHVLLESTWNIFTQVKPPTLDVMTALRLISLHSLVQAEAKSGRIPKPVCVLSGTITSVTIYVLSVPQVATRDMLGMLNVRAVLLGDTIGTIAQQKQPAAIASLVQQGAITR